MARQRFRAGSNGLAILMTATLLAGCSGAGGNNASAPGNGTGADNVVTANTAAAPATPAFSSANLIGTRWRLDRGDCTNMATIEFQAGAIVAPGGPIPVTYMEQLIPEEVPVMPEGGNARTRMRFSMLGEELLMSSLERAGRPCMFQRVN